jgi:hypothetical protein
VGRRRLFILSPAPRNLLGPSTNFSADASRRCEATKYLRSSTKPEAYSHLCHAFWHLAQTDALCPCPLAFRDGWSVPSCPVVFCLSGTGINLSLEKELRRWMGPCLMTFIGSNVHMRTCENRAGNKTKGSEDAILNESQNCVELWESCLVALL